jgi:hypothetical protein
MLKMAFYRAAERVLAIDECGNVARTTPGLLISINVRYELGSQVAIHPILI